MEARTNKKITLIMDYDNIDYIKTSKEFTPISSFIVQILYTYHQDHKSDEFFYMMMKKMII